MQWVADFRTFHHLVAAFPKYCT
jgi:hypothetical protein